MSMRTGVAATPFSLPHKPKELTDVGAHIGRDTVVLLFFPLAFSPVCTDEMCHMRDNWEQWTNLDAKVFGICVDSPFITNKFREDLNVPFPILSDFNKEVAAQYDVLHEELIGLKGVAKRSAFVIDKSGAIVYDWVTDNPGDQVPFDEVKAAVEGA